MYTVVHEKPASFYTSYDRKEGDVKLTHYCPGCGHGSLHKFIAEAIDDLGIQERTVFVSPVGCSVFAYHYLDVGNVQAAHGRAPAVATGIKRSNPESIVIAYQGDGDLAAIGTAEIIHSANRGENITVFFVNNAIYGMTGGQMAPTTLIGQKTVTTPMGRNPHQEGYPLKVCELLSTLEGSTYLERVALTSPKTYMKTRQAIRKALKNQVENRGFSLIEVLSPCPTGWKLKPNQAWKWIEDQMFPVFPLGVYKDLSTSRQPWPRTGPGLPAERVAGVLDIGFPLSREEDPSGEATLPVETKEMKIAGFGGQGVLFMGVALATVAMKEGYHATWLPSYGPEMRGGTANCNVVFSHRPIGTPLVDYPDILIAMNAPSLKRFQNQVKSGGLIVYDSAIISDSPEASGREILPVPAAKMAHELGDHRVANVIILGAMLAKCPILRRTNVYAALEESVENENLRQLNRRAFEAGRLYRGTQS
ncbi:MAG TPA: 2-oxoacid:acceptor oxidoreductase family protein [Terriglobia bacterium]|nr:2-oxoacid:acceptor oxidoreductase family protein [Terriglobia bacterium]